MQTDLAKKGKRKRKIIGTDQNFSIMYVRMRLTSRYLFGVIKFIMARGQRIVMKFSQRSLDDLCVTLLAHAEKLNSLLEPSWPNAEKVHDEMYNMVDTLVIHAVDQKWFSAFAKIGRTEEMVTSQEICAVSWGGLFYSFAIPLTKKIIVNIVADIGGCNHQLHQCSA